MWAAAAAAAAVVLKNKKKILKTLIRPSCCSQFDFETLIVFLKRKSEGVEMYVGNSGIEIALSESRQGGLYELSRSLSLYTSIYGGCIRAIYTQTVTILPDDQLDLTKINLKVIICFQLSD